MARFRPAAKLRMAGGLVVSALCAYPQAYTISAKSGAVNYVEGSAYLDGKRLSEHANRETFLNRDDTLSTEEGKAEVLLSPGVFLRIGANSEIRMISPSLVNTRVEVTKGEAMVEVTGLVKDNIVQLTDHDGSITLDRDGLYRINGDNPPSVAVLEGRALVSFGDQQVEVKKGRETVLSAELNREKFDAKQPDELFAWSNVRSEYEAAASYQTSKDLSAANPSGFGAMGFAGSPYSGWFWANGFDSYAWLPGSGAFYSPFGYGFYSPGVVGYAPVITAPVYSGGHWTNTNNPTMNKGSWNGHWSGRSMNASVPVNPNHPPALGYIAASPSLNNSARSQAAQVFAVTGFHSAAGNRVASFSSGGHMATNSAGNVGVASARSAGGYSGGGGAGAGGGRGGWSGAASGAGGGGHVAAAPSGGSHR